MVIRSLMYFGARPWMALKVNNKILQQIRRLTGNQCKERSNGDILQNLPSWNIRRVAAFRILWSFCCLYAGVHHKTGYYSDRVYSGSDKSMDQCLCSFSRKIASAPFQVLDRSSCGRDAFSANGYVANIDFFKLLISVTHAMAFTASSSPFSPLGPMERESCVSSALHAWETLNSSLALIMYRRGPRHEPWGTSQFKSNFSKTEPCTTDWLGPTF